MSYIKQADIYFSQLTPQERIEQLQILADEGLISSNEAAEEIDRIRAYLDMKSCLRRKRKNT